MNDLVTSSQLKPQHPSARLLPMSMVQSVIWFDQLLQPDWPCYQIGLCGDIHGELDVGLLHRALQHTTRQHDGLRLAPAHSLRDGAHAADRPSLVLLDEAQPGWRFVDLCDGDGPARGDPRQAALDLVQRHFMDPMPLVAEVPPWDMLVVRYAPDRHLWLHRYHHLVNDGYGVPLAGICVVEVYNKWLAGEPAEFTPGPSYLDYLDAEAAYLASPRHEADRRHWRERFTHLPPVLLPARWVAATGERAGSGKQVWSVARATMDRIRALAQAQALSPAHFFLALVHAHFSRSELEGEVVIGVPVHNRTSPKLRQTIGMFASMNPVGMTVDMGRSFTQQMRGMADEMRRCLRHQRLSIAEINRDANLAATGRRQMFDITFSYEDFEADVPVGSTHPRYWTMHNGHEQTPLAVAVKDLHADADVDVELVYARAHLQDSEVRRLAQALDAACLAALAAPEQPIAQLPTVSEAEAQTLLHTFNDTTVPFDRQATLHGLIAQQAARHPGHTALVFEGRTLTYGELDARATRLSRQLRQCGVQGDERVAVAMDRSIALVVALLAIHKAGAAYVPLDVGHPTARLRDLIDDVAPRAVLTLAVHRGALPDELSGLLVLDVDGHVALDDGREQRALPALPDEPTSLAYVLFTSGSTGRPKGVMNEHRAVVNRLQWMQKAYPLTPADRVLQKTPFTFDVSVWEFFWPLMNGATLVLARPEGHRDPAYLGQLIDEAGITVLHFVPSMLQAFLAHADAGRGHSLRHVVCSGEALPWGLAQQARKRWPQAGLHNLYGPTEAAIDVTAWTCVDETTAWRARLPRVPIGRPIDNVCIRILDAQGRLSPIGVAGEVHIGGVGVARGYLNQPELTAERFVRDPFALHDPVARLYKTGDLGRWREDGAIEYLGRLDHQIKVRGQRIELGEIEHQLQAHPAVDEAVVQAWSGRGEADAGDADGDARLVAHVVLRGEATPTVRGVLRSWLANRLPMHMLPHAIVVMAHWPLNANGKLDRKALPAPTDADLARQPYEAPQGELEQALAQTWADLLGLQQVGRHDHFFDLGGHSLLVLQMAQRLQPLGWTVGLRQVFEAPSLAELAALLRSEAAQAGHADAVELGAPRIPPQADRLTPDMLPLAGLDQAALDHILHTLQLRPDEVQDIYPLAPLQEGMLFHHVGQLLARRAGQDVGDPYVMPMLLALDSTAQLQTLLDALKTVVARHDALRTAVLWEGLPQPMQVVVRAAQPHVQWLTPVHAADALAALQARMAPSQLMMDLRRAPLVQVTVAPSLVSDVAEATQPACHVLLCLHHLVDDNHSLQQVRAELRACVEGLAHTLPAPQPYRHFVGRALQRAQTAGDEAFFTQQLAGLDEPSAPFGLLDVHGDGSSVRDSALMLSATATLQLLAQARSHGVTPAAVFHLAWGLVVAHTSARADVVFGTVFSGRLHGGLAEGEVVGAFINTLPMRLNTAAASVAQLLQHTQALLVASLAHDHAPLALAQRCSGLPAGVPLFTSVLNVRHQQQADALDGGELAPGMHVLVAQERSNYPVVVSVDAIEGRHHLRAQVAAGASPERCLALFSSALDAVRRALAQGLDAPAISLQILPAAELQRVTCGFNPKLGTRPECPGLGRGRARLAGRHAAPTPVSRAGAGRHGCAGRCFRCASLGLAARGCRLCDLHLWLHGGAQGRARGPCRPVQPGARAAAALERRARQPRAAVRFHQLRCQHLGVPAGLGPGRLPGAGPPRTPAARARPARDPAQRAHQPHFVATRGPEHVARAARPARPAHRVCGR